MPELDTITIKGFKSIASIENLKLGPINLVIGANGSGKSNFIEVFSFLHEIAREFRDMRSGGLDRRKSIQNYVLRVGGAEKMLHFGSKVTRRLEIVVVFQDNVTLRVGLQPTDSDQLMLENEWVLDDGLIKSSGMATNTQSRFSWRFYHFHDTGSSSPMKKTADVNDNQYLRPDGSNLAAYLYYLKVKHEASYRLIRRTVQLVAPFFDDFQLEPQKLNPKKIQLEWRHKGTDAYFDASMLSDGTLRFIALTTLFLQPADHRPSVILVDEPELGLHPYAITLLASLVKQATATDKTQVILSTQSPLLLDHFQPEDVLVADRVEGGTQLRRLDSEKLSIWLEDYSLGQLWEKNELGGRPRGE